LGKLSQASPGGSSRNLNIDLDSENFEDTIITVLTKKLTVATEKLNLMEKRLSTDTQLINSLKRELNEETMVRKFKQRRIDYLTKKRAKGKSCPVCCDTYLLIVLAFEAHLISNLCYACAKQMPVVLIIMKKLKLLLEKLTPCADRWRTHLLKLLNGK
jgi:uncharacterized coiled-coil protein SlyX